MNTHSSEIQDMARRLVALEIERDNRPDGGVDGAVQVINELRIQLIKLAGADGFRSLLSRALTMARAEAPSLQTVNIGADGSLEGFGEIDEGKAAGVGHAGLALLSHLLELLVAFIGEPLTLRLVYDKWPEASLD